VRQPRWNDVRAAIQELTVEIAVLKTRVDELLERKKPMKYTVKYGDTLSGLAQRFKVDQATLARVNDIDNPNKIYAGREIEIPGYVGLLDRLREFLNRKVI
jgi:LysM repeat protein